jgi:hypothetical protein
MTENNIVLAADDKTAAALVATIRAAVNGMGKYAAYVEAHAVTRDTVKDHARALAVLAYPNDAPVQKKDGVRTRFGNAVQAAGNGLRSALPEDDAAKKIALRVTLSGEGGGSATVPTDHPLYESILAIIAEGK